MATQKTLLTTLELTLALLGMMAGNVRQSFAQSEHSETSPPAKFEWQEVGARFFEGDCSACHQKNGQGISNAFPPLAGHVPEIVAQPMGRDYLTRVVLFGLHGTIAVKGDLFDGVMPEWSQLDDVELASVLDYILNAWGNDKLLPADFKLIRPEDMAAARLQRMTAAKVLAFRDKATSAMSAGVSGGGPKSMRLAFTEKQADRGKAIYAKSCEYCHGANLDGDEYSPTLKGPAFRDDWDNGSVAGLYSFIKSNMPLDKPRTLSEQSYVELTAFLLSQNGYAAGDRELPADTELQERMRLKQKK